MEPEIKYMKAALREARKAEKLEEVPIGCVIFSGTLHGTCSCVCVNISL